MMRTVSLPLPEGLDALAVVMRQDGSATVYEPGDALPADVLSAAAPARVIAVRDFRDRFTAAEQAAFAALAFGGNAQAQLLLLKLSTAVEVDLDSAEVAAGLDHLIGSGVLTTARKGEILA